MRAYIMAMLFLATPLLSGCDQDKRAEVPAEVKTTVTLSIKSDTAIAQVGDRVALSALAANADVSISEYRWTFSDGQVLNGKDVSVSFTASGVVQVKLEAFTGGASVGTTEGQVAVVAPGVLAPASYGFPQTLGDVDNDNVLALEDALLVAQATEGLVAIDPERLDNADMDRDGRVNATDVALMQKAILRGEPLPRVLLDETGRPGAVLAMISPDLLPTATKVEIRVDGQASPQVLRAVRGYATFIVPKGVMKGATPASVELVVDGTVKDRFALTILAPVSRPADAKADVLKFLTELEAGLTEQQVALRAQIASLSLPDPDSVALLAAGDAGLKDLRAAREELVTLLAGPQGDRIASQFQQALYANGMDEFRTGSVGTLSLKTTNSVPDRICDVVLPTLCAVKKTAKYLDTGASIASGACSAVAVAAVLGAISPFDGPLIEGGALATFLTVCLKVYTGIEVASTISSLLAPIEPGLRMTADKTSLGTGESATLRTEITFVGYQELCGLAAVAGGEKLIEKKLGEKIVGRLMRRNAAMVQISRVFTTFGEGYFQRFMFYVRDGVSNALSALQITNAVGDLVTGMCPVIQGGAAQAVAANIIQTPAIDEGSLQFQPDGTAKYFCPPAGPVFKSSIDLIGTRTLCEGKLARTTVKMSCATSPVTITMGDNGSALDDIYEVLVGGRTVLTSSVPTRSVSVTLHLPKGRHEVIMRGLAAPDGIGTYFISFSGAGYVDGDPLSGSDLVPGATKRFTIEVL